MVAPQQHTEGDRAKRGILAKPLDALVFLLPLILFAELASQTGHEQLIASVLLRAFFELFGPAGLWAPGLAVVVILLATHLASGQKWRIRMRTVWLMYVEVGLLAAPLVALNWMIPLGSWRGVSAMPAVDRIALGVGAGIYEELVFRLIFLSLIVMIGADLLRLGQAKVALAGIVLTSLVFAAHHHQPIGAEPFDAMRFTFRAIAGVYLAVIFWYRGYGSAAGCHAAYNATLVLML